MELKFDEVSKLLVLLRCLYDRKPRYRHETWEQVEAEYLQWDNRLTDHLRAGLGINDKKEEWRSPWEHE